MQMPLSTEQGRRVQPATKWKLASHGRWVVASSSNYVRMAGAADQEAQSFVSQSELLGPHPDSQRFASMQSNQRDRVVHTPTAAKTFLKQQLQQAYQDEYINDFVDGFISYLKPPPRRVSMANRIVVRELDSLDGVEHAGEPPNASWQPRSILRRRRERAEQSTAAPRALESTALEKHLEHSRAEQSIALEKHLEKSPAIPPSPRYWVVMPPTTATAVAVCGTSWRQVVFAVVVGPWVSMTWWAYMVNLVRATALAISACEKGQGDL